MPDRYYLPDFADPVLRGGEAHHLRNVMRAEVADVIAVFDGKGGVADAAIHAIHRSAIELQLSSTRTEPPARGPRLTIFAPLPKADRARFLVEKLTELGAEKLVPLITERSVVKPHGNKSAKLEAAVIAACKQCRRNHLLEIGDPMPFDRAVQFRPLLVADRAGEALSIPADDDIHLLIGPEGGWSEAERTAIAELQLPLVRFAAHTLRVETAAIAAAARFAGRDIRKR